MNTSRKNLLMGAIFLFFTILVIAGFVLNSQKLLRFFYPFSYRELITAAGEQFEVDPLLVLAVMKTESKFRKDAVSVKGARGLMQIMPETGQWIAVQLEVADFHPDRLFEPETNILFGAWYLSYLNKDFNNRLAVVLAAYNAGPGKVKEWLTGNIWDGTMGQVENIPFAETRGYLIKVTRYHRMYTEIYHENN